MRPPSRFIDSRPNFDASIECQCAASTLMNVPIERGGNSTLTHVWHRKKSHTKLVYTDEYAAKMLIYF